VFSYLQTGVIERGLQIDGNKEASQMLWHPHLSPL